MYDNEEKIVDGKDPDEQMARGDVENGWNLAIGEPVFIQELIEEKDSRLVVDSNCQYPASSGSPDLVKRIKTISKKKYVVVTNGAKQALLVSLHALAAIGKRGLYHKPPYWPSFRSLASMSGLEFVNSYGDVGPATVKVITYPNNPSGMNQYNRDPGPCDIWDRVYAAPVYGWEHHYAMQPTRYRVSVDSMSKSYGMSGLRVGWMATDEEPLAIMAAKWMESYTSGVSAVSQSIAYHALTTIKPYSFVLAQKTLFDNMNTFNATIRDYCVPECVFGVPQNGKGMFAFFLVAPRYQTKFAKAIEAANVRLVSGESCGMKQPGWWRMNMGHNKDYTKAAIAAIVKEMEK